MSDSHERRMALCGWLEVNNPVAFYSSFKLQTFLFFYEALCKAKGKASDFQGLEGYHRGTGFTEVWEEYTKDVDFSKRAILAYQQNKDLINVEIAQKASFLVSVLSEKDLSELTHKFNIWKSQSENFKRGTYPQPLNEDEFDGHDIEIMLMLDEMYPDYLIHESKIITIEDHFFIISKKDLHQFRADSEDYLKWVIENNMLDNPTYIEFDKDGCIVLE